jgi:type I restriction enzyme R subunit
VCCEPTPLEKAHIIPWKKTHDHSEANLVALCANCHERADIEKWGEGILRRYKQTPCALAANALPPLSPVKKVMIDFIIASDPDCMTELERLRLASIFAAYTGVQFSEVRVVSVVQSNSSRVRVELPQDAAESLTAGFQAQDPRMVAFIEDFAMREGLPPDKSCCQPPAFFALKPPARANLSVVY